MRSPLIGAAAGWLVAALAAFGLRGAFHQRFQADSFAKLRLAGVVLVGLGLLTAILAALGRLDENVLPVVPTRYTPFAVALQLGVLLLHAGRMEAAMAMRPRAAVLVGGLALVAVLVADINAARLLDKEVARVTAASRAFDAGLPADPPMHPQPAFAHTVRRALVARGLPG